MRLIFFTTSQTKLSLLSHLARFSIPTMTISNSPVGSHAHSNESDRFESPSMTMAYGPTTIDSSLPYMISPTTERPVSSASNPIQSETLPTLNTPLTSSVTSYPWLDLPNLDKDRQGSIYSEPERSFASHPTQSLYDDFVYQGPGKYNTWGGKTPHGWGDPSITSMPWEEHPFHSSSDILTPTRMDLNCMRRSFSSMSIGPNQQHPWEGSAVADTMNEMFAIPQSQPFDAADSSGQALYSTAWNQNFASQPHLQHLYQDFDDTTTLDSFETDDESVNDEPPYAKLIYDALMDAPEHQLVLRDIYAWVKENTNKAKDPAFKGWQNSIRHNLSMNGVSSRDLPPMLVNYVDSYRHSEKSHMLILQTSIRKVLSGYWSLLLLGKVLNPPPGTDKKRLEGGVRFQIRLIRRDGDRA